MIADLKNWAWLTQFASLVLVPLLLAYLKGIFAAKTAVEKLMETQSAFETRLSLAEHRLAEAPTQRDFAVLRTDFSALHGDLRALTAELRGFKDLFARAEGSLERLHRALRKDPGGC